MSKAERVAKSKGGKLEEKRAQGKDPNARVELASAVLHLQRTVGNRAVQRAIEGNRPAVIQRHVPPAAQAIGAVSTGGLLSKWASANSSAILQQVQLSSMLTDINMMMAYTALAESHPAGQAESETPVVPAAGGI